MRFVKSLVLSLLFISFASYGALDQAKNFSKATLSGPYNAAATSLVLMAGHGAKLPATPPYNLVWWNSTDYPDPSDDPFVEIIRVTGISTDTLTVTRAQEGTSASAKNIVGRVYKVIRSFTAKEINTDIPGLVGAVSSWSSASGGALTLTGPTISRVMTAPDAAFSVARTDAGQTFTGVEVMTSPSLLGTVSIADPTTPAISLATGKTNTGTITILGKTSGSTVFTTADATAQAVTHNTAAQTIGGSTITIADLKGVSGTFVTGPSAGPVLIAGPTAARTVTFPDAAFTAARTDAANTFTGVQVMTSPSLLGTVSIADATTPAISLASGKTNTGTITVNGKTSGSTVFTTADATAQALTHNTAAQTIGAASITIPDLKGVSGTFVTGPSGGPVLIAGPTAARTVTFPDAAFTAARTDAANTFTGVQVMTSPSLLGTVSIADTTTPAISLATGKTNTGTITINGKTSGSLILTAADATAQAVTLTVAGQTTGAATVTIPDQGGTSRTFVTSPSAGPISFTGSTGARIKTIRDAADTILELGGSYTPTGTWTSLTMVTPVLGTPASGLLSNCTFPACTTSIPNINFPSGTIRTSPVAGDIEFDGVNLYGTMDTTSGRGQIPSEQYFHLASNGGAITTIANFFGTTSNINIVASAYYVIDIYFWYVSTGTGAVTFTFTNSAAPTSQNIYWEMSPITGVVAPPGTATMLIGQTLNDGTAARTIVTGSLSAASHYAHVKFWLKNGTGTTFKIQATSAGTNLTPQLGSFWFCRRVSPNNIGTFAN